MARYKHDDYNQTKMIPLHFADQIQPGSSAYALSHVIDSAQYREDRDTGVVKALNDQNRGYNMLKT